MSAATALLPISQLAWNLVNNGVDKHNEARAGAPKQSPGNRFFGYIFSILFVSAPANDDSRSIDTSRSDIGRAHSSKQGRSEPLQFDDAKTAIAKLKQQAAAFYSNSASISDSDYDVFRDVAIVSIAKRFGLDQANAIVDEIDNNAAEKAYNFDRKLVLLNSRPS
jgi:hypothetical protein